MPLGLVENENLGAPAKMAGAFLWNDEAGRRPRTIVTTVQAIASKLKRDTRCARDYVRDLAAEGFVEIEEQTPRSLRLYVFDPNHLERRPVVTAPAERQIELFEVEPEPVNASVPDPTIKFGAPGRGETIDQHPGKTAQFSPGKTAQLSPPECAPELNENQRRELGLQQLAAIQAGREPPGAAGFSAQFSPGTPFALNLNFSNRLRDTRNLNLRSEQTSAPPPRSIDSAADSRQREGELIAELCALSEKARERLWQRARERGVNPPRRINPRTGQPHVVSAGVARKVVLAVLDGKLDWPDAVGCIDSGLDSPKLRDDPDGLIFYVLKSFQKQFQQKHIDWKKR